MTDVLAAQIATNAEVFRDALMLHVPPPAYVLDMTYGRGRFWSKLADQPYQLIANDIDPELGDFSHDFRELPWPDSNFDAVVFDPPYKLTGTPQGDDTYGNRSNGYKSVAGFYEAGISEGLRVLKPGGVLFVKCMDQVVSGKQSWQHLKVLELAESDSAEGIDLFLVVRAKARPQPHKRQLHSRKNHSFLWVFRK